MYVFKAIDSLVEIEYYEGHDSQRSPEHNWCIFLGGIKIGQAHLIRNEIRKEIGEFEGTLIEEKAITLIQDDLSNNRTYKHSNTNAPCRKPDFKVFDQYEVNSEFWWEEMLMYDASEAHILPIRYDSKYNTLTFFSVEEGDWVACQDVATNAYKQATGDKAVKEIILKDDTYVELLDKAAATLNSAQNIANTEMDISTKNVLEGIRNTLQDLITDYKEDF